jgi:hypothetical protein
LTAKCPKINPHILENGLELGQSRDEAGKRPEYLPGHLPRHLIIGFIVHENYDNAKNQKRSNSPGQKK